MGSKLQSRDYGTEIGDYQLVKGWVEAHSGDSVFAETLLPPVGVIVERGGEPVGACWVYLSAGIGVGFLEWPVTKPGLGLGESLQIMGFALGVLESIARGHDYGALIATTPAVIGKFLEKDFGFVKIGDRVQLLKRLN